MARAFSWQESTTDGYLECSGVVHEGSSSTEHKVLRQMSCKYDVIHIQETHGDAALFIAAFLEILNDFFLFTSCCEALRSGCIAILVRKAICDGVEKQWVPIVGGRVAFLDLSKGEHRLRLWNVHNFGKTRAEEDNVTREIAAGCDSFSLVAGDFNFLSSGEKVLRLMSDGGTKLDGGDGTGAARQSAG